MQPKNPLKYYIGIPLIPCNQIGDSYETHSL